MFVTYVSLQFFPKCFAFCVTIDTYYSPHSDRKPTMKRRSFIRSTAAASLLAPSVIVSGCSSRKEYDLLITGGAVYDGTGSHEIQADVAVRGDRIASIAPGISARKAAAVVEANGLAVAPGFIDPHTHTDVQLLVNPKAESKIRQGVTTEIGGNCGGSQFPLSDRAFEETRNNLRDEYGLDLTWRDMQGFFSRLEAEGIALNYATLLGHGSLREAVMGPYDRPPTTDELQRMKQIVLDCMKAGAVGLSTGLIYTPGSFAKTDEIIELCRPVADSNGVYATHMRNEGEAVLEAIDEALSIARQSGVSLQISHIKAINPGNWSKIDRIIASIEHAKDGGIALLADRYPYNASSTGMISFFPQWAREGTVDDLIARLKDPNLDSKIRDYLRDQEEKTGSWDKVVISSVSTSQNKPLEGKTVLDGAALTGKAPYEFMRDLIIEEKGNISVVKFAMSEDNLRRLLAHALVVIGSDGDSLAPYGVLAKGKPHPRSYGTFPRVLGRYVREEKILSLPEAVRKMTSAPADKFGLTGRGRLTVGAFADIVVFNSDTVIDRATFEEPHRYPEGIEHVIVNGKLVISHREHTGALPGYILRHVITAT